MPVYTTSAELRSWPPNEGIEKRAYMFERAIASRQYNTFLSHSSKDDKELPGVIFILEKEGATVYIDNGDDRLPIPPNPETARVLRERIGQAKRMVVLVTKNSKESKWVPWELGLGDGMRGNPSVALFPSVENVTETAWAESEYFGIYQRIVWGKIDGHANPLWMVWNHHANVAVPLRDWLSKNVI